MAIFGEADETFELSPQEEAEIITAVAETDRCETMNAGDLIKGLGNPACAKSNTTFKAEGAREVCS